MRVRLFIQVLALSAFCFVSGLTVAGTLQEQVVQCLKDSVNGRDRNILVKWQFSVTALHPEVTTFSNISPETRDEIYKQAGKVYTRLLGEDCKKEMRASMQADGKDTVRVALTVIGELVISETLTNPMILREFVEFFEKQLDKEKLQEAWR